MKYWRRFILVGLSIGAVTACQEPPHAGSDASTTEIAKLSARIQQLEDSSAIQKLQSKYLHLLFTQRYDRIVDECYALKHPEVSVEFSDSGVYRGLASIRALYDDFMNVKQQLPGFFILHMAVNPYIEIAADGLSAKSHWLSPGASGNIRSSSWIWGPYYIDYIKEDGQWRILHSNLSPLFRNQYQYSWTEAPDHGSVRPHLSVQADEESTLYTPYNELRDQTEIFTAHPELPAPY